MKVGFVPTWCISGFGLSRGGFGLAEVRRVHKSLHSFIEAILAPFCSQRGAFNHLPFLLTVSFVLLAATIQFPPFEYSSTAPAHYHWRAPFQLQNNQSLRHICLKVSWVLVYPGVESRSFTGAWAGRCVIAHLDDRWGPS
ncbi:uncharacterized protein LACBIDRAFT_318716 [Laccaria bicolor S238N-H82]|uniref:Predicted protein n=1 Tax=Laccaria bicolor (strain S238N-H82 / ATCC MYA-4686) TaxID=486041 RepID=B0D6W4_LACBS|nr:uncharacterized protein LACBIDRAFT_318716 [Laccaria bicolor S238N-H82]EDR09293.1 predicted protein [Laccaria bicolor S238N-H82]|eukprot:XP_001879642.1 predicted protein [Laccaria bicolor S238N-H82]